MKEATKSFVLDTEAVAIDRQTGKLMPFQELSKRKRKDVKVEDIQVRVCLFAFDLLYLNGEVSAFTTLLFCSLTLSILIAETLYSLYSINPWRNDANFSGSTSSLLRESLTLPNPWTTSLSRRYRRSWM